jgi:hypothetical protein
MVEEEKEMSTVPGEVKVEPEIRRRFSRKVQQRRRRRSREKKEISADPEGRSEENRAGEEKLRRDRNRVWSALLYIPELQAGGFSNGSIALIMRGETEKGIRRPQKKR